MSANFLLYIFFGAISTVCLLILRIKRVADRRRANEQYQAITWDRMESEGRITRLHAPRHCHRCGCERPEQAKFCRRCGAEFAIDLSACQTFYQFRTFKLSEADMELLKDQEAADAAFAEHDRIYLAGHARELDRRITALAGRSAEISEGAD